MRRKDSLVRKVWHDNCFSVTGLSRSFLSCLFVANNGVDALLFTYQTFSMINLIISNRTLDFKPRCYSIELSFIFFDMNSGLKVIKIGNDCVTSQFAQVL